MEKEYLNDLVQHEMGTYFQDYCRDPRQAMILLWWVALNSMWDYLGTPDAKYERKKVLLNDIYLTGTSPDINTITIDTCKRDVKTLRKLIDEKSDVKDTLTWWASFWEETVLLIDVWEGKYKSFDGMHRIVGHILSWKEYIDAYVLVNYGEFLPHNEPHVVYDIIKAFQRSQRTPIEREYLKGALKLLIQNTWNAKYLLWNRFHSKYLKDDDVQEIIQEALQGE